MGHQDAVHGAYYVLMWAVVRLAGSGELATRLPSALAMAAAAGVVAMLGRRLVSPRAGLAAGLVFAAMPPVSWFGQDARPFAMETALACVASYLFIRVVNAGGSRRRRWLAAYAAALLLTGLANLFGLLLIAAHGVTLAAGHRRPGPGPGRPWLPRSPARASLCCRSGCWTGPSAGRSPGSRRPGRQPRRRWSGCSARSLSPR